MSATMAGGGDWLDLPTAPVQHRGARKPAGLPWAQITEAYVANGGQVDTGVWHQGKVQIVEGGGRGKDRVHTYAEPDEYNGPGQPGKVTEPTRRKVLTPAERAAAARRYADGQSTAVLAREFDVSTKAISNAVIANGGRLRTFTEAAANRKAKGAS